MYSYLHMGKICSGGSILTTGPIRVEYLPKSKVVCPIQATLHGTNRTNEATMAWNGTVSAELSLFLSLILLQNCTQLLAHNTDVENYRAGSKFRAPQINLELLFILQMRKLRDRNIKEHGQGHKIVSETTKTRIQAP